VRWLSKQAAMCLLMGLKKSNIFWIHHFGWPLLPLLAIRLRIQLKNVNAHIFPQMKIADFSYLSKGKDTYSDSQGHAIFKSPNHFWEPQ
jgi:hypothetical protein